MAGAQKRKSLQKFHILRLATEYVLVLITFIIDNLEMFHTNSRGTCKQY